MVTTNTIVRPTFRLGLAERTRTRVAKAEQRAVAETADSATLRHRPGGKVTDDPLRGTRISSRLEINGWRPAVRSTFRDGGGEDWRTALARPPIHPREILADGLAELGVSAA